eukprot:TRINITY_DN2429_c0_g1_i5.p1 TRINITY_DN2429_c0_g1~~TRINITY_DN2429_c0_g1_i5.p1  ORF type:complete len:518 (-),score=73.41 TRINITY_DN2429_c0_g1_i5:375-1928(-)
MGCGSSYAAQGSETSNFQEAMICDMCQSRLNFINRKKVCDECGNCFCKNCLPRETGNSRTCSRCKILVRRPGERTELMKLRVKDLQSYLCRRKINIKSCVEKKDLVELVLQTNGESNLDGNGRHSAEGVPQNFKNRVPASNSWQDNTIRVSDQVPLERPSNFPQSYVESTHRREFFERFGNSENLEEDANKDPTDVEPSSGISSDVITVLDETEDNSQEDEKRDEVDPADRILPFHQDEDLLQFKDDHFSGTEDDIEVTPVEVIETSETLVENIEGDESIGFDQEGENLHGKKTEKENQEKKKEKGNEASTSFQEEDRALLTELNELPDITSAPETSQASAQPGLSNSTQNLENTSNIQIREQEAGESSPQASGATKKMKPDLLAESSTSLPSSPRRFANQGVVYLSEITSEEDFKDLSAKQVKEILAMNRVNFKGCVEKEELLKIVERLWREEQRNKEGLDNMLDESICKICMDAVIDCVMLECGHMCTCTNCGKQMAECPICRQYVVRVVRTFKS